MSDTRQVPLDRSAEALFVTVYARLKAMAARQLASRRNATLDTTELVHELYLRMGQREALQFEHPAQFFSYAARAMRHLLINRARDRLRLCAGGQWQRITLDDRDLKLALDTAEQALALDAALDDLEADRRPRRPGRGAALFRRTQPGAGAPDARVGPAHDRSRLALRPRVHQGAHRIDAHRGSRRNRPSFGVYRRQASPGRIVMASVPSLRELFEAALPLSAAARTQLLAERCADPLRRAQVERMLAADAIEGELLSTGDAARAARAIGDTCVADALPAGSRIGPFELVEILGEGGSSTVFRAFRDADGVRQEVAIKLLARGLYTADAQRQFRREREALARLRHPGIARLIEGGITDGGPCLHRAGAGRWPADHALRTRAQSRSASAAGAVPDGLPRGRDGASRADRASRPEAFQRAGHRRWRRQAARFRHRQAARRGRDRRRPHPASRAHAGLCRAGAVRAAADHYLDRRLRARRPAGRADHRAPSRYRREATTPSSRVNSASIADRLRRAARAGVGATAATQAARRPRQHRAEGYRDRTGAPLRLGRRAGRRYRTPPGSPAGARASAVALVSHQQVHRPPSRRRRR